MRRVTGHPATSMDDYQLNTTTFIRHAARTYPEQEIVYYTPAGLGRYTYAQAHRRMMRLANALESLGVAPGDRVGVLDWNSHRHFELYFAIPGTGAVLLQMNLRISTDDLSYVGQHSEVSYICVDESLLPIAEAIAGNLPQVKGFIVMSDRPVSEIATTLSPVYGYEELLADAPEEYNWPMVDETSAYSACYTSGTTGRPKGVYYSHRNIHLHSLTMAAYLGINSDDCALVIVPMFHGQSWGLFYSCVMMGAKLIFPGRYTAEEITPLVDLMIAEQVTIAHGAPAIFQPMLHYIRTLDDKPDFSRARFLSGATEPPLSMMRGFQELTGAEIIHAYGATETTPLVAVNYRLKPSVRDRLTPDEQWDLKRKQGLPVTGVDVRVLDEDGQDVNHDGTTVGEICMAGPWIAGRYHDAPASEEAFRDGYWHSGDAGTIDPDGYLKVVDRIKDVIKSGGEWISSIDMENAIAGHPNVLDAAVVGLPHDKWQERPLALVVTKEDAQVTEDDLRELLLERFARWQLPDEIRFVAEIPKTSVGKTNKKTIVAEYHGLYTQGTLNE
ncbi:long-chain-fatty-acid--CoA ligase [Prauserella muralis]|uniref:AMP-dependent synthetase n=1 Tax=Prauserella muralis TaxID=588067 RepID=A0A2V4AEA6_9PSEU|nr:long-chain-fatty-acid--CoA ligase [Prauserella muralis]PXY17437.1 AMP-dependent synthetase [Prauserella muralis]TWE23609.1 fatty-acyl-CoA synthase [Prauserella muralis]